MKNRLILIAGLSAVMLTAVLFRSQVTKAATPDGLGPWADSVVSTAQGLRKDGSAVPAVRSDATSMLGPAENDTIEGHFYSLGFGGKATLGFDNGFADGLVVVEATNPNYATEYVKVEVSEDGTNFTTAGTIGPDGAAKVPDPTMCVRYVRLTDASNKADFADATADGYDVDGVTAYGRSCTDTGRMTGGGSMWAGTTRVTHGMELPCDASNGNLEVNWAKNKFHLDDLQAALCTFDPSISSGTPKAAFNTYYGQGLGSYNGTPGYHAYFIFTDNGEPGKDDTGWLQVKDPTDTNVVFTVPLGKLANGNQQAH